MENLASPSRSREWLQSQVNYTTSSTVLLCDAGLTPNTSIPCILTSLPSLYYFLQCSERNMVVILELRVEQILVPV